MPLSLPFLQTFPSNVLLHPDFSSFSPSLQQDFPLGCSAPVCASSHAKPRAQDVVTLSHLLSFLLLTCGISLLSGVY